MYKARKYSSDFDILDSLMDSCLEYQLHNALMLVIKGDSQ